MKTIKKSISRRNFLASSGVALAGGALINPFAQAGATPATITMQQSSKTKLALVGTGIRGIGAFGNSLIRRYPDKIEYVGLCDKNPGRVEAGKEIIGVNCPTYSDLNNPLSAFDKMMNERKPELVIVCTTDSTHDDYIVRGMELGANIITEKPMATDERKIQRIIDAENRTGKKCLTAFNYRYSPLRAKMYELLNAGEIGELTSIDFNWYLDISHGADYFRRWHRLMDIGGSLWVHKACHHFDLLNWWIDSDPETVYALGALEFYGKNGPFRAENCRTCPHIRQCQFYWQIERPISDFVLEASGIGEARPQGPSLLRLLYINNEHYDGYLRDGCVFKNDIDIYDKMAATIKYMNGVQVSYSLTAYSPYEGYRIAFNGTKGRMDAWIEESNPVSDRDFDEIVLFKNFGRRQYIQIPHRSGHGGGDNLMRDQMFIPDSPDPLKQKAGVRDGSLACLIGIAARRSIESGQPIKIADMTSIKPQIKKQYAG